MRIKVKLAIKFVKFPMWELLTWKVLSLSYKVFYNPFDWWQCLIIVKTLMIPNSKDGIDRKNCTPPMTTHDERLRFVCNCPSYMRNPIPEPSMTWNYVWLKKRKFKGICHLFCQSVSKSQTLVFTACKMPAMQIHYRPYNRSVFSNSRPAEFHARLDRVDDTMKTNRPKFYQILSLLVWPAYSPTMFTPYALQQLSTPDPLRFASVGSNHTQLADVRLSPTLLLLLQNH